MDIILEGSRIREIKDSAFGQKNSSGIAGNAAEIDCTEKYILPGLTDLHGHFFSAQNGKFVQVTDTAAELYLAYGITTVCSKGELNGKDILHTRDMAGKTEKPCPRILAAGPFLNGTPHLSDAFLTCRDGDEMLRIFEQWKDEVDLVKVYQFTTAEMIEKLTSAAHEKGLKVYGHLGTCAASEALEAGLDGVEHGIFYASEFWDQEAEEGTPAVLRLKHFKTDKREAERYLDAVIRNDAAVTPTASTVLLSFRDSLDWFDSRGIWELYQGNLGEQLRGAYISRMRTDEARRVSEAVEEALEKQKELMKELHLRGGRIFAGTDPSVPYLSGGVNMVCEAEHLRSFGMSEMDVLASMTVQAAEELGIEDITGSAEPGLEADLLILEKNPAEDLKNLETIETVIKGGRAYSPDKLKKAAAGTIPEASAYQMMRK
ncbi:MAG: amidohydrolase family protein [Emergencia sp.]